VPGPSLSPSEHAVHEPQPEPARARARRGTVTVTAGPGVSRTVTMSTMLSLLRRRLGCEVADCVWPE